MSSYFIFHFAHSHHPYSMQSSESYKRISLIGPCSGFTGEMPSSSTRTESSGSRIDDQMASHRDYMESRPTLPPLREFLRAVEIDRYGHPPQMNRNPLNEEGIALEAFGKEEKTPSPQSLTAEDSGNLPLFGRFSSRRKDADNSEPGNAMRAANWKKYCVPLNERKAPNVKLYGCVWSEDGDRQCSFTGAWGGIKRHIQGVHLDYHPWKCPYDDCDATFTQKSSVAPHVNRIHTGDKPYRCTYCPETFYDCSERSKHHLRHAERMFA